MRWFDCVDTATNAASFLCSSLLPFAVVVFGSAVAVAFGSDDAASFGSKDSHDFCFFVI